MKRAWAVAILSALEEIRHPPTPLHLALSRAEDRLQRAEQEAEKAAAERLGKQLRYASMAMPRSTPYDPTEEG